MAPFDAAACFLAIGMAIILGSWGENYGDPSDNKSLLMQFKGAAVAIASGKSVILFFLDSYLISLKVKFTKKILVEIHSICIKLQCRSCKRVDLICEITVNRDMWG